MNLMKIAATAFAILSGAAISAARIPAERAKAHQKARAAVTAV